MSVYLCLYVPMSMYVYSALIMILMMCTSVQGVYERGWGKKSTMKSHSQIQYMCGVMNVELGFEK